MKSYHNLSFIVWVLVATLVFIFLRRKEDLQFKIQGLSQEEAKEKELALAQAESEALRQRRHKISIRDFENVRLIGRGAFGEVWFSFLSSNVLVHLGSMFYGFTGIMDSSVAV